jgi:putative endonuclease
VCPESSREKGAQGEETARRYLQARGYHILVSNFRARTGEIDIIMKDRDEIVFVEVKSARSDTFGNPAEWVSAFKQRRIIRTSLVYVQAKGLTACPMRYDVITVDPDRKVSHVRDAFRYQA